MSVTEKSKKKPAQSASLPVVDPATPGRSGVEILAGPLAGLTEFGPAPSVVPQTQVAIVALGLPIARHGHVRLGRIECKLTPRQSGALRLLFDGLQASKPPGTILLGGVKPEPVVSQHDAIRWVLDKIADGASGPATPR